MFHPSMKRASRLLLTLALLPACALAQEKQRKTLTFQPGAKTPDATPAPVAKASPAPAVRPPAVTEAKPDDAKPSGDDPAKAAEAFFTLLGKNLVEQAYANLTRGSKIADRPEELQTLKARTNDAIQIFGTIHGHELLESKQVGAHLLRRTYLSLGHDFPLRWRFYYYKTGDQWRLVDLRVDDRLSAVFEEPDEAAAPAPAKQ
jgi:hypothetical protein